MSLRSEALQLNESLRLAHLDRTEGEGQLQILKDKIAAKNLEGERQVLAPALVAALTKALANALAISSVTARVPDPSC